VYKQSIEITNQSIHTVMKQDVQSNLNAAAPAFTPGQAGAAQYAQPQAFSPELMAAARNHATQLAQMKQAFALHPLLQQALILQADLQQKQQQQQQKQQLQQQQLQCQTKTKKKFAKTKKSKDVHEAIEKPVTKPIDDAKAKPYKRVIAINLPVELQSIDTVTSVFHPYGDVTLVRVLKPGKALPFDTKQYAAKIPELGTVACALVDFETARAAKFAVHVLRQRADEVGFRLAILKPGVEEKLYADDESIKQQQQLMMKNMSSSSDSDNQIDSGVTSETSDESRSISDGDVDSDLNNSRASISSEDEQHKNDKILKKRHSLTSDTDNLVDFKIKHKNKKEKSRVVSSVTIFLKSPEKQQQQESDKQKFFSREELLKLQYPCPNLANPFGHVFDEIERNTASIMKEMSRNNENQQHQKQHSSNNKRPMRKHTTGKRFQKVNSSTSSNSNKSAGFLLRA